MDALRGLELSLPRTKTAGLSLLLALMSACAAPSERVSSPDQQVRPRRPSLPAILVLMPASAAARETYDGLAAELSEEFDLLPYTVDEGLEPADLAKIIRERGPSAVVLMNNPTLRLFRQYRVIAPPDQKSIPAIALLTSFLRETSEGIENLTGVIYEVPLVTSLVNLRALLEQPVRRVGVLYRPIFAGFIEEQRRLSADEGFELVGVEVSGRARKEITDGLSRLRGTLDVDAIWVLNDNVLLQRDFLRRAWLPALRNNRTPVVVNVRSLVSREVSFGTFAVLPDHPALGTQTAQLISSLAAQDWSLNYPGQFEYPISVEKVLDVNFARQHLDLREKQLATVDQLVE